ncbi:MAG TPA: hypothetical protein DCX75_10335, partial [Brevundimonas sp.]|nr:hypothetical protein [Brevundimonas sp.]
MAEQTANRDQTDSLQPFDEAASDRAPVRHHPSAHRSDPVDPVRMPSRGWMAWLGLVLALIWVGGAAAYI